MTYNAAKVCRKGGCGELARSNFLEYPDADGEFCVKHAQEARRLRVELNVSGPGAPALYERSR